MIDSFISPAAAGSAPGGSGFACSYATILFTLDGGPLVAVKLNDPSPGCNLTNTDGSYHDSNLGAPCNGVQYGVNHNNQLTADGTAVPPAAEGACSHFTLSGCTVSWDSHVSVEFVLIHDGSIKTGTVKNGTTVCGPTGFFTVPSGGCGC
jgi:hypothetical protein